MSNYNKKSPAVNYHTTTLSSLDLDIDNYSLQELYNLFNIQNSILDEPTMRQAKTIVLKMHPDKSRLDSKYFLFFTSAYRRLFSIYEFQNKTEKKVESNIKYECSIEDNAQNTQLLNQMFEKNKHLKNSSQFNGWFNETFEKHRIDDPLQEGYGEWLKSNDGIIDIKDNVTKGNMNDVIEKHKKQTQNLIVYAGIADSMANTFAGSLLDGGDCGGQYLDLKEAYTQTLIPVTADDFNNIPKFNSVNEYKSHRDRVDVTPISNEDGLRRLAQQRQLAEQQSAALAMKHAKQERRVQEKQQTFWSGLKQLTGF
jgi:hypothetical protein